MGVVGVRDAPPASTCCGGSSGAVRGWIAAEVQAAGRGIPHPGQCGANSTDPSFGEAGASRVGGELGAGGGSGAGGGLGGAGGSGGGTGGGIGGGGTRVGWFDAGGAGSLCRFPCFAAWWRDLACGLGLELILTSSRPRSRLGLGWPRRRRALCGTRSGLSARRMTTRGSGSLSTRGSPTSAASGGGSGGFSNEGTTCNASSPPTASAAPLPRAPQRIRIPATPAQGLSPGQFSPQEREPRNGGPAAPLKSSS
jgi:hypothetical protein